MEMEQQVLGVSKMTKDVYRDYHNDTTETAIWMTCSNIPWRENAKTVDGNSGLKIEENFTLDINNEMRNMNTRKRQR